MWSMGVLFLNIFNNIYVIERSVTDWIGMEHGYFGACAHIYIVKITKNMPQNFCKLNTPPSWKCGSAQLEGLPNAVAVIDGTSNINIHLPKPTYRLLMVVGIISIESTRFVSLIILIHYALYKRVLCTSKWYTYHACTEFFTVNRPKPRSNFPNEWFILEDTIFPIEILSSVHTLVRK